MGECKFSKLFVIRMDNRLHYVSLTSNVKQAHKEKRGRDSATRDFTKKDLVVE